MQQKNTCKISVNALSAKNCPAVDLRRRRKCSIKCSRKHQECKDCAKENGGEEYLDVSSRHAVVTAVSNRANFQSTTFKYSQFAECLSFTAPLHLTLNTNSELRERQKEWEEERPTRSPQYTRARQPPPLAKGKPLEDGQAEAAMC